MDRNKRRLESQLCKAVKEEDPRCVQVLLSQGASGNVVGSKGVAAVHLAVGRETEKSIRCLKLLLQRGVDPNLRSTEGLTPLHVAALWGCYQNIKLLLANGGNPNVTDQEGNTPGQLAEQQDNRKCAQLLQNHQARSADLEDLPRFQYPDQTDMSSYPDSDSSASSRLSMVSDLGEDPWSSTRHSALFDCPGANPPWRGGPSNRHVVDIARQDGEGLGLGRDLMCGDGPLFLSSTRMSTVGCTSAQPHLQEDVSFGGKPVTWAPDASQGPSFLSSTRMSVVGPDLCDGLVADDVVEAPVQRLNYRPLGLGCGLATLHRDTALTTATIAGRAGRKSVSFREVDEYVPVFSPRSPEPQEDTVGNSDFLNSECLATVLHKQGIDVTSPDHVYVFDRDSSQSTESDLEKTSVFRLEDCEETDEEEEEEEEEEVVEIGGKTWVPAVQPPCGVPGSLSSGSGSHYSSCDSDHYTTAHGGLLHTSRSSSSEKEEEALKSVARHRTDSAVKSQDQGQIPARQSEQEGDPKLDGFEDIPALVGKLSLSDQDSRTTCNSAAPEPRSDPLEKVMKTANAIADALGVEEVTTPARCSPAAFGTPFTPSPFVTGRTRSRLSRCSTQNSSLLSSSSSSTALLFEQTLAAPVRTRRQTPRSHSSEDDVFYSHMPPGSRHTGDGSGDLSGSSLLTSDLPGASDFTSGALSDSQADTFILPRGGGGGGPPPSPSLPDTIILERKPDSPTARCEEYLRQDSVLEAVAEDTTEGEEEEFLTDDRSSTDKGRPQKKKWRSSRYFSPRRSREDSSETLAGTPGTASGCTPRYSMSRLSHGPRRSRSHLPALQRGLQDYTPGGRPLALDLDLEEPVEYLYTDTEQGHELIETHIPPMADTSLSTSTSSGSNEPAGGDETMLYNWRSLRADVMRGTAGGKENQARRKRAEREAEEVAAMQLRKKMEEEEKKKKKEEAAAKTKGCSSMLPDTRGITDKELRRRLLDLGERPGPISPRTRPVYLQRLRGLILQSNTQPQSPQPQRTQPDQQHTNSGGYSVELSAALRTFQLPDCHVAELQLSQQFDQPDQNKKWREGLIKSSFNYLLLDPRVTKNLPYRSRAMSPHECFQTFVHAVFYVGKGKRSRPYSHLYEALEYFKGDKTSKKLCPKVQHILRVWDEGQGVISLHCFQNVIPLNPKPPPITSSGLKMLTNQKRGDYYGVVSTWLVAKRRELGVHLLYRAMQIFLAEGERQLRPADIKR
ncbi:hypothetical protein CRUP_022447 [Coryphaenoides rupestris]|nr:hypothetical protein CRUP_022447 [Coryphaenoides rupestris]